MTELIDLFAVPDDSNAPHRRYAAAAEKLAAIDGPLFTPLSRIVSEQAAVLAMISATNDYTQRAIPWWDEFIDVVLDLEESDL